MRKHWAIIFFALLLVLYSDSQTSERYITNPTVKTDTLIHATTYPKEVEDRIKQVEENVSFVKFQIKGMPIVTLQEAMEQYGIKGISIAVIHDYKIEWAKGYGWADSAEKRNVTTETTFCSGSVTKSINAMGVLRLSEDKKLDLNADINDYLISWKFPYDTVTKSKVITITNLLSHTAGLPDGPLGSSIKDSMPTLDQILPGQKPALNNAVHVEFEPGQFHYSNFGVMVTQKMIEDITHQTYENYMSANVLTPLGMTNSFYLFPGNEKQSMATGYNADGTEVEGKHTLLPEIPAGGLWSTPTDICKYIIETQLSLKGKSNKILSKEMTKKMLTPYIESVGLGVFIQDEGGCKYFTHVGVWDGFRTVYYGRMDDGDGVVVMCNTSETDGFLAAIVTSVARVYKWKGFNIGEKSKLKTVVTVPDSVLNICVGAYKHKDEVATIFKKDNCLWYQAGGLPWKIYFTSNCDFINLESKSEKRFYTDSSGKVKGFTKTMDDKDLGSSEKLELVNPPDSLLEKYTGTYKYGDEEIKIEKKKKELYVNGEILNFFSNADFYIKESFGAIFEFYYDQYGKVDGVIIEREGQKEIVKKIN
ncbi:MAG: serine hydrolase domain-containing protein [Bacteroidia bacterium]